MTPDAVQVQTFVAVVDHGSFDAAARVLNVTPSAVSQRIRGLENALGQTLVERALPARATAAGERLLRYARQVQVLHDDLEGDLDAASVGIRVVSISVNADSLATWFLPAFDRVTREHAITLELHREDEQSKAAMLRAGRVMAAVTADRRPVVGCRSTRLGVMRYRAVASPAYVDDWLSGRPHLAQGAPIVTFDRSDDLQHNYFRTSTGNALGAPRHYIPSTTEHRTAVLLGLGWGMIPEIFCSSLLAEGALVDLTPGRTLDVPLHWQRWKVASTLLDTVTELVAGAARSALA
ncbi:LysR family transcriptional regulator [Branchiibius hedensis]|uniref:Transcriptional regulator, LysR family n=1 Tax=Branchiibius hedensis TaxID=672460 RepID=A0A2Y8ZVW3_9MICO|nr:LysR family transcriptional regulator ArgP [Branchiibius hedensis]PWJ27414.1 LysR family transcriptional regulator [Branchiibius hedensis]SSA36224.1 transcriptional regulator, LysR family [Branchiibius hedensis]